MKKQWLATVFGIGSILLVGLLWLRVRELEKTVSGLEKQLQTKFGVVSVRLNEADQEHQADKQQVFKLIGSPDVDPEKSKVGVPWDVERAMMGGTDHSAFRPSQGEWQWKVESTPDVKVVPVQPDSK
jgi:hypothetical protein